MQSRSYKSLLSKQWSCSELFEGQSTMAANMKLIKMEAADDSEIEVLYLYNCNSLKQAHDILDACAILTRLGFYKTCIGRRCLHVHHVASSNTFYQCACNTWIAAACRPTIVDC